MPISWLSNILPWFPMTYLSCLPQFYSLMMWHGKFLYEQVRFKSWAWKDIFSLKKIIFLVNKNYNHWMVVTVYPKQCQIWIFDSMSPSDTEVAQNVLKFLKAEYTVKNKGRMFPNEHAWKIEDCKRNEPRQTNGKCVLCHSCSQKVLLTYLQTPSSGVDCGIFTCLFIRCLVWDIPMNFCQAGVTVHRNRLRETIKENKVPELE